MTDTKAIGLGLSRQQRLLDIGCRDAKHTAQLVPLTGCSALAAEFFDQTAQTAGLTLQERDELGSEWREPGRKPARRSHPPGVDASAPAGVTKIMYYSDPTPFESKDRDSQNYAVTVVTESPRSPEARQLLENLWQELASRYDFSDEAPYTPEQLDVPGRLFLAARIADEPVGCGALLPMAEEGVGEIRRMWVEPAFRRQGVAKALLFAIESMARELGMHTLRLATGDRQPEAIALYEQWEFYPIDCWEAKDGPDACMRCFEKRIRS